jgi:hypothetical protein
MKVMALRGIGIPHFDDLGDGRYDFMGISVSIPMHARLSVRYLAAGDRANALSHAKKCLSLCAAGMLGSFAFRMAERVRNLIESAEEYERQMKRHETVLNWCHDPRRKWPRLP